MVGFEDVPIFKVESTSRALPLLKGEEFGLLALHERMLLEPFCPVDEVSIIRAGMSFHLCKGLVMRIRMFSNVHRLGFAIFSLDGRPEAESSIYLVLVFVLRLAFCFQMMSCLFTSGEVPQSG